MSDGPELFVVVQFSDKEEVFAVADAEGTILQRDRDAIRGDVHGVLSSEDEIDDAANDVRYAVPVDLAREVFGWDL
jgi:hypothetical protein